MMPEMNGCEQHRLHDVYKRHGTDAPINRIFILAFGALFFYNVNNCGL